MKLMAMLSFLVSLIPRNLSQSDDYPGYLRAQDLIRLSYQFTREEADGKPQIVTKLDFAWDSTPWMLGLRGKDIWGRWITEAECNLMLVKPNVGLVPCSCVWSWYFSFTRRPRKFRPLPDRTTNDISGPELFAYYTRHPTKESGVDYFQGVQTRFVAIVDDPVYSFECEDGFDAGVNFRGQSRDPQKLEKQLDGFTVLQLESPIMQNGNIPVQVPEGVIDEVIYRIPDSPDVDIIIYGGKFLNPTQMYIPKSAANEYERFHERWRTWNNNYNLEYEQMSIPLTPAQDQLTCRKKYVDNDDKKFECWQPRDYSNQICNYSPGSALRIRDSGELYGIVMNANRCPEEIADDVTEQFEVRRINSNYSLKDVMSVWEFREGERKKAVVIADKAPRLYNLSIGSINYDEDIDPRLKNDLSKVVQKKYPTQHSRSTKFRSTWFRIVLVVLHWYYC